MHIDTIISGSIIIPSFIISIVIFISPENKYSLKVLPGFYLIQVAILTLSSFILSSYKYMSFFPIAHIGNLYTYCLAPTMFLYVKNHLSRNKQLKKEDIIHFIPFILILTYYLYQVIFNDMFYGKHNKQHIYKLFESIQSIIYFTLTLFYIKKHTGSIKYFFLNKKAKKNTWLSFLVISSFLAWFIKLNTYISLEKWGNIGLYFSSISIYMTTSIAFITAVIFFILNRPEYFKIEPIKDIDSEIKKKIYNALIEDDFYRDINLKFKDLADKLHFSEKDLSKAINENFKMSYYQLVNRMRIEKCIELMSEPDNKNLSITDYQYEVGFASKSSFYSLFKSHTGLTPLKYKKMISV